MRHHGVRLAPAAVCVSIVALLPASTEAIANSPGVTRASILDAEDRRAPSDADLRLLIDGTRAANAELKRLSVRALGRLERRSTIPHILPLLDASSPAVRAEAANALGQALRGAEDRAAPSVVVVADALVARLTNEVDEQVQSSIYRTLGRLAYADVAAVRRAEAVLARGVDETVSREGARLGAVKGLESLIRPHRALAPAGQDTVAKLRGIVVGRTSDAVNQEVTARTRRLALGALVSAGGADRPTVESVLGDPDVQMRRLAALAIAAPEEFDSRATLVARALRDTSPMVRVEALRAFGRRLQASNGCASVLRAVGDESPHVALLAIDLLGQGCRDADAAVERLELILGGKESTSWHAPAHALISLARLDPERARTMLDPVREGPPKGGHHYWDVWQFRMYAARAAAIARDAEMLERFAADENDNVREAAITGLMAARGHHADAIVIGALEREDYQLIRAAAEALKGSPNRGVATRALVRALARLTRHRRDTSRDPRLAIIERLGELGDRGLAGTLEPHLGDFDPRVAAAAAGVLRRWTGTVRPVHKIRPTQKIRPARSVRLKADATENVAAKTARAIVTMAGRGRLEIELFADEAPATVRRFVSLARSGAYNGRTFHRVVPNFVIQGGSPGANEYAGYDPYMRDELGLRSHVRGALGISTRGRDTGDAQIFINLADNPRLDHDYTVFGEVIRGIEVVDTILEGDVIEKIEIVTETR